MWAILGLFSLFILNGCGLIEARVEANKAYQAYQKKDYLEAIAHYEAALEKSPGNVTVIKNLGFSHLELAREGTDPSLTQVHYNKAIDSLFLALKDSPRDKELSAILVDAWTQTDRLAEATTYYRDYVGRFPSDPEAWRVLGQIEVHRGNYQAALETYEKRQALSPDDLQIISGKAVLCWEWLRAGGVTDPEQALKVANIGLEAALKADRKDPMHPTALVYAGLLLRQRAARQKDPRDSQKDLLEAQKLLERIRARNKGV